MFKNYKRETKPDVTQLFLAPIAALFIIKYYLQTQTSKHK